MTINRDIMWEWFIENHRRRMAHRIASNFNYAFVKRIKNMNELTLAMSDAIVLGNVGQALFFEDPIQFLEYLEIDIKVNINMYIEHIESVQHLNFKGVCAKLREITSTPI
jgi:hypothetical protein